MTTTATTLTSTSALPPSGKWGPYNDPVLPSSPLIRKIIAENISMTGGAAAVLLQIANRGVGLGVAAHSSFTKRPVERARRSLQYIYGMAFGTEAERRAISDATHRAHSRVRDVKRGYDANDPTLQLWVAATMYWSLVTSYENVYGVLGEEEAELVYKEFSVMATGLRVKGDMWPRDRAAFKVYWDKTIESLEVTHEARAVTKDVLWPKGDQLPWHLWAYSKAIGPANRSATIEMLPERIRTDLGLQSTAYTRYMYWVLMTYNRTVYPMLPDRVRHFTKNYFLADLRDRLAKGSRL